MRLAIGLARRGGSGVSPNPRVGALLVRNGRIIGRGWHRIFGGPHAEVMAIRNARGPVRGATIYVNLEPCNIYGKTPPCTDLLIRSGIRRVVVGSLDPNPAVSGRGIRQLRKAGIRVTTGVLRDECETLNEDFAKYIRQNIPFVTLKIAQTLDGRIADTSGRSKWITGPAARASVHRMRAESDAILVGAGTVNADNPRLTARISRTPGPLRIVLDGRLTTRPDARIFGNQREAKTILLTDGRYLRKNPTRKRAFERRGIALFAFRTATAGKISLRDILRFLGTAGIKALLVEGGAGIFSRFLEEDCADRILCYTTGLILGAGLPAISYEKPLPLTGAKRLHRVSYEQIGHDILITGYCTTLRS